MYRQQEWEVKVLSQAKVKEGWHVFNVALAKQLLNSLPRSDRCSRWMPVSVFWVWVRGPQWQLRPALPKIFRRDASSFRFVFSTFRVPFDVRSVTVRVRLLPRCRPQTRCHLPVVLGRERAAEGASPSGPGTSSLGNQVTFYHTMLLHL